MKSAAKSLPQIEEDSAETGTQKIRDAVRDAIDAVAALNGEAAESADSPRDEATHQATQNLTQQKTQNLNGQGDIDAPIVAAGATSSETSRARN